MNLHRTFSLAACALVVTFGLSGNSMAASFNGGGFVPAPPPAAVLQVQPSPQQMQDAQAVFDQYNAAMQESRQQLWSKQKELNQLLGSQNPDKDRIQALSREIGEIRGKMLTTRSDVRTQLQQKGLSPDFYGNHHGGGFHHGFSHRGHGRRFDNGPGPHFYGGMNRGGCGCQQPQIANWPDWL